MRDKPAHPDAAIAQIAARQHGIVSLAQLLAAGLTKHAIHRRVAAGRLHPVHRGVYAVGHRPVSRRGFWKAATLALGGGAVLSHLSAAALWELLPDRDGYPHVTLPRQGGRDRRRGIVLHRSLTLTSGCSRSRHNIPVTSVARTIADLRRTESSDDVRKAIRQADFLGLPLGPDIEADGTRSPLEGLLLGLCRRYGLPEPEVNARIGRFDIDFLWREERFAVEADGWAGHRGHQAFEDDRERGLELARRGIELIRLSDRQVRADPPAIAAVLGARLSRRAS